MRKKKKKKKKERKTKETLNSNHIQFQIPRSNEPVVFNQRYNFHVTSKKERTGERKKRGRRRARGKLVNDRPAPPSPPSPNLTSNRPSEFSI